MSDFSEWLEAGAGTDAVPLEEEDLLTYQAARDERDAVLCLVDCNPSMFQLPAPPPPPSAARRPSPSPGRGGRGAAPATIVKQEGGSHHVTATGDSLTESAFRHTDEKLQQQQQQQEKATKTPFQLSMQAILNLYKEKIITSERDVLALALYNTAEPYNKLSLEGVYIIHAFNTLGVDSIQEVERLEAAGVPGSAAHKDFTAKVGHRRRELPSALPDALWAAQHMFQQLRSDTIKYRRIFVFTNDDNPTLGDELSRRRCVDRARDLCDARVELQVFALAGATPAAAAAGDSARSGGPTAPTATAPTTGSGADGASIFASVVAPLDMPMTLGDDGGSGEGSPPGSRPFDQRAFWDWLLQQVEQSVTGGSGSGGSAPYQESGTYGRTDADADETGSIASSFGAVRVCGGGDTMPELQQAVRQRVHAQRPILSCRLVLGAGAPGQVLPAMAVSIYTPIMRARPPAAEWLERATNAVVKRRNRLVVRPPAAAAKTNEESGDDAEDAEDAEEAQKAARTVAPEEVQYSTTVGGTAVRFTAAERAKLVEVAAAGAGVGLTVVCFKSLASIAPVPYALSRSSFVHPNLRTGGTHSLRLFVQLVRTLHAKGRVAVAQFRLRAASAPRLVALLPAVGGGAAPAGSLPAEGLGFYLCPLPYGDDLRPDPDLATATLAVRQNPPRATAPPTAAQVALAKELVERLTVGYSLTAVPNPTLQLHYRTLEDLAVRRLPTAGGGGDGVKDEDSADGARQGVVDYTLPDTAGMARFRDLMHDFNTVVLSGDYSADALCPGSGAGEGGGGAGGAAARRGPSPGGARKKVKEEGEGGAAPTEEEAAQQVRNRVAQAEENGTLDSMTVVELKEYLRVVKAPGGGAKRKAELIDAVKAALKKEQKKVKKE